MKPLLQVTRQDEEIQVREAELQKAKDNLSKVELDYNELDKKHAQVNNTSVLSYLFSSVMNQCLFTHHHSSSSSSFTF